MKHLTFERHVPHPPEAMFDLVADLEAYPKFIPNCTGMVVKPDAHGVKLARMSIAFGPITQAYTSRVEEKRPGRITAKAIDGPFAYLDSAWTFEPEGEGTFVRFEVDFKISNPVLRAVAEPAFAAKQDEIMDAFLREAERRYGRR
jgi:coenzyme Q-binding protein COQ10